MKFKCVNCGHVFQAEDSTTNNCPVCGSINVAVQPASNKPYMILFGVFCVLIIVCLIILLMPPKDKVGTAIEGPETEVVEGFEEGPETTTVEEAPVEGPDVLETPMSIDAIKVLNGPTYKSSNKTWSFSVSAELNDAAIGSPVVYEVTDAKGNKIANTSGQFSNISSPGNTIQVVAKLKNDESVQATLTLDTKVDTTGGNDTDGGGGTQKGRVTKEEVQGWINNLNATSNPLVDTRGNTKVAPGCRFTITGLNEEDSSRGLGNVRADKLQEKVMFDEWASFTVESIECDPKTGMLKAVTARVHYPAD